MKCNRCKNEWNTSSGLSIYNCPFCSSPLPSSIKQFDTVEDVLIEMNQMFDTETLADGKKLIALFSDLAPNLSRQRRVLGYFAECDGPQKIVAVKNASISEQSACVKQIVKVMKEEMYIDEAAALRVCKAFLFAITEQGAFPATTSRENEPKIAPDRDGLSFSNSPRENQYALKDTDDFVHSGDQDEEQCSTKSENNAPVNASSEELTESRVVQLLKNYNLDNRYYWRSRPGFHKKLQVAMRDYPKRLLPDETLLVEYDSVLGLASRGFVLTSNMMFCELMKFSIKSVEDVYVRYAFKRYRIYLKLKPCLLDGGSSLQISATCEKEEADRIEAFWRELLFAKG